ncbi:MAG: phosphoribosylglycinamide formyltransferase [Phycisphaerales bacterium]|nr:phosphoribosylglycinamide formyltransferase [Phycisphaerales bacterium]
MTMMNSPSRSSGKIAVMLSGSGRSLENLCHCIDDGTLDAEIAVVITSRECLGAQKSRAHSIPTRVVPGQLTPQQLDAFVDEFMLDLIVLAGYLKRIPITKKTRGRIINIHPALLPNFGGPGMHGLHVHRAVLKAKANHTGCTVHFCDETYDTGSTIHQLQCPIEPGDTAQAIADKVFRLECKALPHAVSMVLNGL